MQRTKIDWADYTWNPVWGCRNDCLYCYARRFAQRLGESFEPHWIEKNYIKPMPRRPSRIFVNSMSDCAFWMLGWWDRVMDRIQYYPEHSFFFLSKKPMAYPLGSPSNCWFGVTITNQKEVDERTPPALQAERAFVSIEPIHGPIDPESLCGRGLEWVILGAETGNRKERIIPPPEWIKPFLDLPIPLFMKRNLPWQGPWRKEYPA